MTHMAKTWQCDEDEGGRLVIVLVDSTVVLLYSGVTTAKVLLFRFMLICDLLLPVSLDFTLECRVKCL